jgi:hypothetical protein
MKKYNIKPGCVFPFSVFDHVMQEEKILIAQPGDVVVQQDTGTVNVHYYPNGVWQTDNFPESVTIAVTRGILEEIVE